MRSRRSVLFFGASRLNSGPDAPEKRRRGFVAAEPSSPPAGGHYVDAVQIVRAELADDPTIDITTTGRRSGTPRRIEIWMLDVDGRFFITGTPGSRGWLANLGADPLLTVHLKRRAHVDLDARADRVTDEATRRRVLEHLSATWYRGQVDIDELVATAPMVEVTFP